jgi:hypothetical protein
MQDPQQNTRPIFRWFFFTMFLFLSVTPGDRAAAQGFSLCSWPFEVTGQGVTNVATPDTNATYWVMPVNTSQWPTVIINGEYAQARFFNFVVYSATGAVVDSRIDADLAPDPGSTNPFAIPVAPEPHNYTIKISGTQPGSGNTLQLGNSFAFIVYRVYVADQGLDRAGGVRLPAVTQIGADGNAVALEPCPFATADSSAGNLVGALHANGFNNAAQYIQEKLSVAPATASSAPSSCTTGQPTTAAVNFTMGNAGSLFPNPTTAYLQTLSFCFQPNDIVVIRGKAPVFPDTYHGFSIFKPAIPGRIQLRYWSMCNNDENFPQPVVACQADWATKLDHKQFYTYVLSNDIAPPVWLPSDATWLPWGAISTTKNLIFRNTIPYNFTLTGAYYPEGVFCLHDMFVHTGWKGCFAAAGVIPP